MTTQPLLDTDDSGPDHRSVESAAAASSDHVRIPHAPGLDGLRGLAVAAVLVFHLAPESWLPGGFLGVSLFFTLSGFLITSLALAEVRRDRTLAMDRFWARRVRRLIPALALTLLGVIVASKLVDFGPHLRADLLGGETYTSNWVLIAQGNSYADLFLQPSPLTHLWSLAIEEQFYLVLPVVVWLLARRAPWQLRRNLTIGAAVTVVAGIAWCQIADDPTIAYYGTINRAPEIALGVLLATLTRLSSDRAPRWLTGAGIAAMVATVLAWRFAHVTDGWITGGGLALFAVLSATLVWVGVRPGPMATALAWRPLRALGLISYGVYLFHWPVRVVLSYPRIDWAPVPLFLLRLAVSLGLAIASYRWIEQPIRRGRAAVPPRQVILAGLGCLAALLLVTLALIPKGEDPAAAAAPAPAVVDADQPATTGAATAKAPPRVVLIGDSVPAFMLRDGGAALDPDQVALVNGTLEACDGAAGNLVARSRTGLEVPLPEGCTGWPTQYPPLFQQPADVAVLMIGNHAVLDHQIAGEFHGPCEPVAADWYRDDVKARLEFLETKADKVVLVLPAWADRLSQWINPPDYLDRADCVRTTMAEAAAAAKVPTVDFGAYLCPDGRDRCRGVRTKDGMHLDPGAAGESLRWVVVNSLAAE